VQSGPARTTNASQVEPKAECAAQRVTTRTIMAQSSTARLLTEQSATVFVRGTHDLVCWKTIDEDSYELKDSPRSTARSSTEQSATVFVRGTHDLVCYVRSRSMRIRMS
jgi:hypothetical protein